MNFNNMAPQPNQNGYIQMQPIGNINTSNGYNMGGYYTNVYNNYFNPYLARQQQELMEAKMREQANQQVDMMKFISRKANRASGYDISDEELDKLYKPDYQQQSEVDTELNTMHRLAALYSQGTVNTPNMIAMRNIQMQNYMHDQMKQRFPDSMGIYEYGTKAHELVFESYKDKMDRASRDISKLYNQDQYSQLVKLHSNTNNYFQSTFNQGQNNPNTSVNDLEISLPTHLKDMVSERRAAFINSILGG